MWNQIAGYASEHRSCLHHCLPGIKPESQQSSEDDAECAFDGVGIFCHAFNELQSDLHSNETEYYKEIVNIKKHKHCICHFAQDRDNCPVHDGIPLRSLIMVMKMMLKQSLSLMMVHIILKILL